MSNTKKYTAEEVARMIADRAAEIMKKHEISSEYMEQILEKSKNTAHEIDAGEEPNNDDAECPASLGGEGSSEKSESSEDASMEDEPLQGDNDSDTEEETEEDDDEEDEEDEYEFAKSEACGHVIEYKRLAKRCWEGYEPTPGKKAYTKDSCQKKSEDELSEEQKEKMDTDKDGDIDAKDLKNLRHAKKSEDNIKFKHSNEAGQQTDQSEAQQAVSGIKRKASLEDQSEGKKQKRHRMNVDRAESGKTYGKKSSRVEDKGVEAREEGRRSASAPKYEGPERRSKQRVRGEGHIYKSESGMFTVEYNRLTKGRMATNQEMQEIRDKKQSNKLWDKWNKQNKKFQEHQEKIKDTKLDTEHPQFGQTSENESKSKQNFSVPKMAASEDSKVKETKGIEFDKKQDADKTKEEKKGVKRPLEKCGEIKKEEMDKCGEMSSGKKLKKFLGKMKKPSPGMMQEPQE